MNHSKYFNAEGIKLAPKQGEKPKYKHVAKDNKEIEICLNCSRKKCTGYCKQLRKQEYTSGG